MNKKIVVYTLILFVLFSLVISCADSESVFSKGTKDIVQIEFSSQEFSFGTKSLSVTGKAPTIKKWTYTATVKSGCESSNYGVGEVSEEKEFAGSQESLFLSKGWWTFKVYGYQDCDKQELVYYGTKDIQIKNNTDVVIPYSKLVDSIEGHTLAKSILKFVDEFTIFDIPNTIPKSDMSYLLDTSTTKQSCLDEALVEPGTHSITLTHVDTNLNTYSGKAILTAYAGYTYTIGESININGKEGSDKYYLVIFDRNSSNGKCVPPVFVKAGDTISLPDGKSTTRSGSSSTKGYALCGWNTEPDGSGVSFIPGSSFTPTEDTRLYAMWQGWVQLWFEDDGNGGNKAPKWAEFNIGSTISSYSQANQSDNGYITSNIGGYYQWGGTTDKDTGSTKGVNYYNGSSALQGYGTVGQDCLGDTAKLLWGNAWEMPNYSQIDKLIEKCKWEHYLSSVNPIEEGCTLSGSKVSGTEEGFTENYIFLPYAGEFKETEMDSLGSIGFYWSSTKGGIGDSSFLLDFGSHIGTTVNHYLDGSNRSDGCCVRAIVAQ